jgi:uncharacterized membrane protein
MKKIMKTAGIILVSTSMMLANSVIAEEVSSKTHKPTLVEKTVHVITFPLQIIGVKINLNSDEKQASNDSIN